MLSKVNVAVKEGNLSLFDWDSVDPGSKLHNLAVKALEFCQLVLTNMSLERGDHRNLCQLIVVFLGGSVEGFKFTQPGAHHEARFMADANYLLTLKMTENVIDIMDEKNSKMVDISSKFVSTSYGPWFLKSSMTSKAPAQDLEVFDVAIELGEEHPNVVEALKASMLRHTWYLTESLVIISLADPDISKEQKLSILGELVKYDVPDEIHVGKPALPKVVKESKLEDFVGDQSWHLFQIIGISKQEVTEWLSGELEDKETFKKFKEFVLQLHTTNDCAERDSLNFSDNFCVLFEIIL